MINSTHVSYFVLSAYFDTGDLKYLYFLIILSLHEPMYMFLCSLFLCIPGAFSLAPRGSEILSDIHTISVSFCFLQIFCIFSYACVEFTNLAVMSYDRYLAICSPLPYNTRMTYRNGAMLIALAWSYSVFAIATLILLIAPLQLCGNIINKVYCFNYSIVKLACSETKVNNVYGLIVTFVTVFVPLILIIYTYMRILKQTRQKAVSTCTPHLASLLNFSFGVCFEILQSRLKMKGVHSILIMSQVFRGVQRLVSQFVL
uniref:G-protein coupled receptors family 1 profile domain-containing protein n=1 Tax=Anabas testudineus TaxID=64144 RepID=A0A3Q1JGA6_ANATE